MSADGAIQQLYREILKRQRVDLHDDPLVAAQTAELTRKLLDLDGLTDCRHQPYVTIDNHDSRDLDQALFIERHDQGFTVWYALADAAHFVRPNTPLFERALQRGTSFYLPGFSVPMLPAELSEGLISLNPHVERRALIFKVDLDQDAQTQNVQLIRGVIISRGKLAYDDVQAWLDGHHKHFDNTEFEPSLRALVDVGLLRIELAKERDAISFERFEPAIHVTPDGSRFEVQRRMRNDVERYNEQISLLCNMEGARLMTEHGHAPELQSVFRVHLPPLSQRLRELDEMLRNIVKAHKLSPQWAWLPDESLAEYLGKLPHNDETARVRIAIERQVRYANRSSDFSSTVGPHFALGVDHYARFTAPMREIVGIFTHKEALEVLGFEPPNGIDDDIQLRDRVIEAANRGNATQRAIDKEIGLVVIRDIFDADLALPKNQRPIRPGTVVGLRPTQIYILLDDLPVDVKIWVEHLQEHTGAQLDLHDSTLTSSQGWAIRIGDEIRIQASHFDQGRQHVVLVPIFD